MHTWSRAIDFETAAVPAIAWTGKAAGQTGENWFWAVATGQLRSVHLPPVGRGARWASQAPSARQRSSGPEKAVERPHRTSCLWWRFIRILSDRPEVGATPYCFHFPCSVRSAQESWQMRWSDQRPGIRAPTARQWEASGMGQRRGPVTQRGDLVGLEQAAQFAPQRAVTDHSRQLLQ